MARKKRAAPAPGGALLPPVGDLLAEDLRQADELAAAITGKASPENRPFLVLWLAVERLTAAVQASARVDNWEESEAATKAKAQEVGLTARPGEKMPDFRARIRAALWSEGGRG